MRENTPAPLPDDLGNTREHSAGGLSNTSFSPQEADLLLRIAAAESKLAVPGRLHPDSLFGAALKLGEAKAAPQGTLSSAYESGGDSAAIGYDAKGGTSYGLYQIASNSGTMNRFLKFLASKAPDLFAQLAAAAPDNTGGKHGDMPDTWKRIAAEQGKRFAELQHQFIRESHYEPAAKSISMACGLVVSEKPKALREVLWSTSVQHGVQRATEIFVTAADNLHANGKSAHNFDRAMIEEIYRLRSDHFDGRGVQNAVRKRLQNEKENAVAML